ncbi:MAG: Gfo/Idh/MocA family oxidoreductase [Pseudomonadota bacterium]
MTKRIKIGLAGAGVFGGYHASKYADGAHSSLAFVFDPDISRARSLSAAHGAAHTDNFGSMLKEVDAVVIAAPASVHESLARQALHAGKHVFVEKPLALSAAGADELAALARHKGLVLQVGHQERFVFESVGVFAHSVSPQKASFVRHAPATGRGTDVSVVFDLMIHDLDLALCLFGGAPMVASATGDNDYVRAELVFDNDARVDLSADRNAQALERKVHLHYNDARAAGDIVFDFVGRSLENSTGLALRQDFAGEQAPVSARDPLAYGASCFVDAIVSGDEPPIGGRDGARAVSLAEAIERKRISAASNESNKSEVYA